MIKLNDTITTGVVHFISLKNFILDFLFLELKIEKLSRIQFPAADEFLIPRFFLFSFIFSFCLSEKVYLVEW